MKAYKWENVFHNAYAGELIVIARDLDEARALGIKKVAEYFSGYMSDSMAARADTKTVRVIDPEVIDLPTAFAIGGSDDRVTPRPSRRRSD
jgi:hypothetical protein